MNIIEHVTLSDEIIREWIKWLSYKPEFIEEKIKRIYSKRASSLTTSELKEIIDYKESKEILNLFIKYSLGTCTKKEKNSVNVYVKNHDIEDVMNSKLSTDELKYVKDKLIELKNLQYETISIMEMVEIDKNKEVYEKLSMTDAYIFHYLSKISFDKYVDNLNQEISNKITERLTK